MIVIFSGIFSAILESCAFASLATLAELFCSPVDLKSPDSPQAINVEIKAHTSKVRRSLCEKTESNSMEVNLKIFLLEITTVIFIISSLILTHFSGSAQAIDQFSTTAQQIMLKGSQF